MICRQCGTRAKPNARVCYNCRNNLYGFWTEPMGAIGGVIIFILAVLFVVVNMRISPPFVAENHTPWTAERWHEEERKARK